MLMFQISFSFFKYFIAVINYPFMEKIKFSSVSFFYGVKTILSLGKFNHTQLNYLQRYFVSSIVVRLNRYYM